jgi:hypothetical protein
MTTTTPMIAVFTVATVLGAWCLVLLFDRARKPTVIGLHLLAGMAGLETLVATIHMSGFDADSPVRALGIMAAAWFGVAALSGLLIPLACKGRPQAANLLLVTHIGSATAGFCLALAFAGRA